jgi:hypothetical protein
MALDVWNDGFSEYLAQHTLVAGALSGVAFLLIGYLLVDWLVDRRDWARWEDTRRVALVAVGRSVLNQRRAMEFCVSARERGTDADFHADAHFDQVEIETSRCLELCEPFDTDNFELRLRALLADDDWRLAARGLLREASHSASTLIGRWAPTLAASRTGVDVLEALSNQADALDELQRCLYLHHSEVAAGVPIEHAWVTEMVNAMTFHEWLLTQAKQKPYTSSARKRFTDAWPGLVAPPPVLAGPLVRLTPLPTAHVP